MLAQATTDLRSRWRDYRQANPNVRIRDAAREIGSTEAELVAAGCGDTATALRPEFQAMLRDLPGLGNVMCLTRNDHCVHERKGVFEQVSGEGPHGLVLGPDIDLRIFFGQWKHAFAVKEDTKAGVRRSLQFFGADGEAVHKIYATNKTDVAAFDAFGAKYASEDQSGALETTPAAPSTPDRPDAEIDVEALKTSWRAMKDTHEFFGMLRKHKVGRVQAMRLVGEEFVRELTPTAARLALESAARSETPIMVFVGSKGCIQIHSGPVKKLVETGPWFNVLDPDFNLHLRQPAVARAFSVRKPTSDGIVTSIEIFDDKDDTIALFFGARKPGKPELEPWRSVVVEVERQAAQ